jgi:hypothetical protein
VFGLQRVQGGRSACLFLMRTKRRNYSLNEMIVNFFKIPEVAALMKRAGYFVVFGAIVARLLAKTYVICAAGANRSRM